MARMIGIRVALLCFISALSCAAETNTNGPRTAADLLRSAENQEIVSSAEEVEVCMLYPAKLKAGENAWNRRYDSSEYRAASPAIAAFLRWKLVSDSSYRWSEDRKACMPTWNARIRFTKSGQTLTVDLCFGCDILQFSRDGRSFATWDFDPASAELFDAVRILFPKDRVVREIERQKMQKRELEAILRARAAEANKTR